MNIQQPAQKFSTVKLCQHVFAFVLVAMGLFVEPALAGPLTNTVTVSGTSVGKQMTATSSVDVTPAQPNPQLTLEKFATVNGTIINGQTSVKPGDTITYKFTATNTGNVTLKNIKVQDLDATLDNPNAVIASLGAGLNDTTTFTATHVLSQADIAKVVYTNIAHGTADVGTKTGGTVTTTARASSLLNVNSSLDFAKTAQLDMGSNGRVDAGDVVTYTFTVTNTGNSDLHNVVVSDPMLNLAMLPGQERTIALLTGANEPADQFATASIPQPIETSDNAKTDSVVAPANHIPQLVNELRVSRQLVSMAGAHQPLAAGDKIGFVYTLVNAGEAPLTAIDVQQPDAMAFGSRLELLNPGQTDAASVIYTRDVKPEEIASGTVQSSATIAAQSRGQSYQWNIADGLPVSGAKAFDSFTTASITPASQPVLPAGQSTVFTATYKLSQADIDKAAQAPNYYLHNTASVSALDLAEKTLTKSSSADLALAPAPGIALVKTGIADLGPDNVASANDVVTYNFAVTNTGNVTLHNVTVADTDLAPLTWTGSPISALAPGQTDTSTYSATYKLVQNDVNNAKVTNKATATGTPPSGPAVTANSGTALGNTNPTVVDLTPKPAIGLVKTVKQVDDVNGNPLDANSPIVAGDTIEYAFTVKNTGNQTLNGITVTDTVPAGVVVTGASLDGLAPGASNATNFSAKYKLTQADVDAGKVNNQAHVVATAPGSVTVQDDSDPLTPDVTANNPTTEVIPAKPALTVIKTQSSITYANGSGPAQANDTIKYTFAIKNVGNVTLKNVHLTDSLPGATVTGNTISQLLPGTIDGSFTASYPITAQDILAGQVSNQATAFGTSPAGGSTDDVSALSDNSIANQNDPTRHGPTITPLMAKPAVAVIKTVKGIEDTNHNGATDAGDKITYAFSVKNVGNVPLSNVTLVEKLSGDVITGGPVATLNAGSLDTTSFTSTYVLTAADVKLGVVTSQVAALAQPIIAAAQPAAAIPLSVLSDNSNFVDHNPTIAYLGSTPAIGLIKKFDHIQQANAGAVAVGDIMYYTMSIVNKGNVALVNVTVADPIADVYANGVLNGTLLNLGPGATDTTTFTARHTIVAADFSNGGVANQATAYGYSAVDGSQVTDLSDPFSALNDGKTFYPLTAAPGIGVIKTISSITDVNGDGHVDEGDIINYAFTIANTGNVDLVNVQLVDPNATLTPASFTIPSMPVGANDKTTFTASHVITGTDTNALSVSNQATASGDYVSLGVTYTVTHVSDNATLTGSSPTVQKVEKLVTSLAKSAAKGTIKRGDSDVFTITATNLTLGKFEIDDLMPQYFNYVSGTAKVNGNPVTPVLNGNKAGIVYDVTVADKGKITLTLTLAASGALDSGKYVNNAQIEKVTGGVAGPVLATAQATVTIADEAVFDCSDIIGRVFDDKNMNGYMDDGEPGLPGVRIATLNGLLITTDANGLYHVPCAAIPDAKIGSNYLLKLDTRTLPLGYTVTSENPHDVRVTRGKVTKLNFGAGKEHDVQVDLSAKAFDSNGTELSSDWQQSIERLIALLQQQHSVLKLVYQRGNESEALAVARVKAVQQLISDVWTAEGGTYQLAITGTVEAAK